MQNIKQRIALKNLLISRERIRGLYLSGILRYQPILQFIHLQHPATILDIGSGLHGIAPFASHGRVTVMDLSFPADAKSCADLVVAGSMTKLPFSDNSYDLVLSCHALEHIPNELRHLAFAEMVRVSKRWIVLSCPSGRDAEQADIELSAWFDSRDLVIPDWLDEHVRYGLPDLLTLSRSYNCTKRIVHNISIGLNTAMARYESIRFLQILSGVAVHTVPHIWSDLLRWIFSDGEYYDAVLIISKNSQSDEAV